MVRKHIIRNRDNHIKEKRHIGADDEYIMVEVFGTDYENTLLFTPKKNNLQHSNTVLKDRLGVPSYISPNINPMKLSANLNIKAGLYLIEIVYEQNSILHKVNKIPNKNPEKYDSGKDLLGSYRITPVKQTPESTVKKMDNIDKSMPESVKKQMKKIKKQINKINETKTVKFQTKDKSIKFDGENNVTKRITLEQELTEGEYKLEIHIPSNCYFKGMIIRKVVRHWGTNTEEVGTNVYIEKINVTDTEMCKPREAKITLAYDTDFESRNNPNGLTIGYGDECNIFVKNSEDKISQIFGGYVDEVNKTDTTFELSCKDRLRDTEKKYIMDHLTIQNGTKIDVEHRNIKNFNKYGELLKFLCDICEVTLKNNIPFDYWLLGEKHHEGHIITYGKKKDVKKIPVSNGMTSVRKNGIMLRNNSDGLHRQVFKVYTPKRPISLEGVAGGNMHVTIGMGNPKTSQEIKDTVDVDVGSQIAGAFKWTKCGVSPNKKYVMGIGRRSAGKTSRKYTTGYWRSIFVNKCPNCKAEGKLRWDSARSNTECVYNHGWHGSKKSWGIPAVETEITCIGCDSDFDAVSGWEKMPGSRKRLKVVRMGLKSSKHEQDLLHKGKLVAPVKGNIQVSADQIFKAIKRSVKGYRFKTGLGSTCGYLEKYHVGDCWAWSAKIKKELMKYKVNCKIVQYPTTESARHRSVLYQNSKGKYVDFPYREYNFPLHARNTSGSKHGKVIDKYTKGGRINQAVGGNGSISKTETRTINITKGYDVDAPLKGYFELIFSVTLTGAKKRVYIDFTVDSTSDKVIGKFNPVFVNNTVKQFSFQGLNSKIRSAYNIKEIEKPLYLHEINFITPKLVMNDNKDKPVWYTNDETTRDGSSCKMILHKIAFDNQLKPDPAEYESCGKTINELLSKIIEEGDFLIDLHYNKHRCDDVLNFRVNDNITPSFYATDKSNILKWNSIQSKANTNLFNKSIYIFKRNTDKRYYYIERCDMDSMLLYGEKPAVSTVSDETSVSEAYWNVRHDPRFNPEEICEYGIVVMGYPDVRLEDLISVDSDNDRLDDVKTLKSINMTYDPNTRPSIRTELGLNEKSEQLFIRDLVKEMKNRSMKKEVSTDSSADPITDENIYVWDY